MNDLQERETYFYAFETALLSSLKAERMFYGKALVLLNIFMGVGVLGNGCADWRQFYTSVPHMMWAPYLFISDPMSRRPICWFLRGDTKSKIFNKELTTCRYVVGCSVILILFQESMNLLWWETWFRHCLSVLFILVSQDLKHIFHFQFHSSNRSFSSLLPGTPCRKLSLFHK